MYKNPLYENMFSGGWLDGMDPKTQKLIEKLAYDDVYTMTLDIKKYDDVTVHDGGEFELFPPYDFIVPVKFLYNGIAHVWKRDNGEIECDQVDYNSEKICRIGFRKDSSGGADFKNVEKVFDYDDYAGNFKGLKRDLAAFLQPKANVINNISKTRMEFS